MVSTFMTTQQAYEAIRAHFTQPGVRYGYDPYSGSCCYRTETGDVCAVGCLISHELYEKILDEGYEIEGEMVRKLAKIDSLRDLVNGDGLEGERKLEFLAAAQRSHDTCAEGGLPMHEFIRRLDERAQEFRLTT